MPLYGTDNECFSLWTPSTTHDADRRRALSGTQPVSAKQVSSLIITLILLRSFHKLLHLGYDVQNRRRTVGGLTTGS